LKKRYSHIFLAIGIIVWIAGLVLKIRYDDTVGTLHSVANALWCAGSAIIGASSVGVIRFHRAKRNPAILKQIEISEKDERNIRVREKAGYITWYVMLFTLAIIMEALYIRQDEHACLIVAGALVVCLVSYCVCLVVLKKRM